MVTFEDAAAMALALPEVTEGTSRGMRTFFVNRKGFVWERGFTKADVKRFGDVTPPAGPILAVRTADLDEKASLLESGQKGFFTISHFDGFPAVLVQLRVVGKRALRRAVEDAWLACAPAELAAAHLASMRRG